MLGISVLLAAAAEVLHALDPALGPEHFTVRSWSTEQGLPQSSVSGFVQTPDKYLYVATYGGLFRFDGIRFVAIDDPENCGNRFASLELDASGTVWAGTARAGLCRIIDGRLAPVSTPGEPLRGVSALAASAAGGIWASSVGRLLHIRPDGVDVYGPLHGIPNARISALAEADDGTLWVGTTEGLCLFAERRCNRPDRTRQFEQRPIVALLQDRDGSVWVAFEDGLYRIDGDDVTPVSLDPQPGAIRRLYQDRDGSVWIATHQGDLYRANPRLERLSAALDLPQRPIMSLFEDHERNLWLGFSGAGMVRLAEGEAAAAQLPPGLATHRSVPVAEDAEGALWIGIPCAGLVRQTDRGSDVFGEAQGLANTCVWSLLPDRDGSIWIGTYGGGLFRLDRSGTIESRNGPPTPEQLVRVIYRDVDDRLLVGSEQGLWVHGDRPGAFTRIPETEGLEIQAIEPDGRGRLWLGTRGGLVRLGADGIDTPAPANALAGENVRDLYLDADGVLWIGNYGGGLARLAGETLTRYDRAAGLGEDVVSRVIEDRAGRLWLTGNAGVTRIARMSLEAYARGDIARLDARLFDADNGMPSSETNGGGHPAGTLRQNGQLWVPTISGVAVFDTTRAPTQAAPRPVHIEQVRVDGVSLPTPATNGRLTSGAELKLDANARNLEIHYTAPAFRAPEDVRFRYRLEGFDAQWNEAGTRRVAYYPVIPSGDLRFEVVAAAEHGGWSPEGAVVELQVEAPLVQRPWFIAIIAVLAGLLGALLVRRRATRAARRRRLLQRQVAKRTAELSKLAEVTEYINRAVKVEEVLDHIYDTLHEVVPYDRIGLALLAEDGNIARLVWSRNQTYTSGARSGHAAPIRGPALARMLESDTPQIVNDLQAYLERHPDSESTRRLLRQGIRSSLTCPLKASDKPVGFLFLSSNSPNVYQAAHIRFLRQLAGQLALVVGKSRLYDDLLAAKRELEATNRRLEQLAGADGLTGIDNRRSFDRRLTSEWARLAREQRPLALLMIDVDFFKAYNDHYGHVAGDECLRAIARALSDTLRRETETVARIGGEEFGVILAGAEPAQARVIAERLRRTIRDLAIGHGREGAYEVITASIGVATTVPAPRSDSRALLEAADQALYRAKRAGRDRIVAVDLDGDPASA